MGEDMQGCSEEKRRAFGRMVQGGKFCSQWKKEILLRDLMKQDDVLPCTEMNAACTGRAGGPFQQGGVKETSTTLWETGQVNLIGGKDAF